MTVVFTKCSGTHTHLVQRQVCKILVDKPFDYIKYPSLAYDVSLYVANHSMDSQDECGVLGSSGVQSHGMGLITSGLTKTKYMDTKYTGQKRSSKCFGVVRDTPETDKIIPWYGSNHVGVDDIKNALVISRRLCAENLIHLMYQVNVPWIILFGLSF